MLSRTLLALPLAVCSCSFAFAAKNSELSPQLISAPLISSASPTIAEDFDEPLGKVAAPVKGQWRVVEGCLVGKELAADKHAAVLNYQKPNRNSAVQFSFKFDDSSQGFHFSLNHAKGHLFRVVVAPDRISVNLDKDKKDPNSKVVAMGTAKGDLKQGQWYTMLVEMRGQQVVVQVDNGMTVAIAHPKLDTDKPNYRFVTRGQTLSIDDLKIWEVN